MAAAAALGQQVQKSNFSPSKRPNEEVGFVKNFLPR